jgi:hypothetical protein
MVFLDCPLDIFADLTRCGAVSGRLVIAGGRFFMEETKVALLRETSAL